MDKTTRDPFDFYPTPRNVVAVLSSWLDRNAGISPDANFLDPAAGTGDLISGMRDVFGESHWSAFEIRGETERDLEDVAEDVTIGDALFLSWPSAHVVANPPFSLLDDFWARMADHRDRHRVWVAALVPVAWWSAEKRRRYAVPDCMIQLGWRPTFRERNGPAHKGRQDFSWCILAPSATGKTDWLRAAKP